MYCIHCGVQLADTEKSCPLCGTVVYHPDLPQPQVRPLYPKGRYPKTQANSKALNGIYIFLFFIPMLLCFFSDLLTDHSLDWFGFVAGGLLVGYIALALPLWFRKPNPVIFVPCNFVTVALYMLYINLATGGAWFLPFAFPLAGALCLIVSSAVTLLYYIKKGQLFVWGGAVIAMGALMLLVEGLTVWNFGLPFIGWSVYPLVTLSLFGGILIYLAINKNAREALHRKLFF